jgi:hypothetical protein
VSGPDKLATIECSTCSALIEVFPAVPGSRVADLQWAALASGELCKSPPLNRCPHIRADIKRCFPDLDV